ncbi:MAG TPA: M14 family zinc carboxypeptidase [Mycobacteriales bacterium]|nr:M14 family zinc carboxypeptidase [Mycobacteriales bacterium]
MDLSRRTFLRTSAYAGTAAALAGSSAASAAGLLGGRDVPAGTVLQLAVARPQTAAHRALLSRLDDTHAVVDGGVELLLWPGDAAALLEAGVPFTVTVPDLLARDRALEAAASAALAGRVPGGKDDYQPLDAIYAELDELAARRPDLARVVTLPHPSLEGRTVKGIELSRGDAGDGRPVAYFDGCHHAREWPSADYCRIFAHHLVETAGTPRTDAVLDGLLVRIVPVVNVDGYVHSFTHKGQATDNSTLGIVAGGQGAYVRKNNRVAPVDAAHAVDVAASPVGEVDPHYGVDPNRNYAYLWGGTTGGLVNIPAPAGETVPFFAQTSPNPVDQTYFGTDAFSEPDTRNTRDFFLSHAVVTYLSNHTQGRLVLRPWGHTTVPSPDDALLTELGQALSDAMRDPVNHFGPYENKIGLGLYATNGTSNDWAYAATGTLGYVIEHSTAFHPPYTSAHAPGQQWPQVVEMFTRACEEALRPRSHSVLTGTVTRDGAPVPARLTLTRTTATPYSRNGGVRDVGSATARRTELTETVSLVLETDGAFTWHVNPSSRPIAERPSGPEAYTLVAEALDGSGTTTQQVVVDRGQARELDLRL